MIGGVILFFGVHNSFITWWTYNNARYAKWARTSIFLCYFTLSTSHLSLSLAIQFFCQLKLFWIWILGCGGAQYARDHGIPLVIYPKIKSSSEGLSPIELVTTLRWVNTPILIYFFLMFFSSRRHFCVQLVWIVFVKIWESWKILFCELLGYMIL